MDLVYELSFATSLSLSVSLMAEIICHGSIYVECVIKLYGAILHGYLTHHSRAVRPIPRCHKRDCCM